MIKSIGIYGGSFNPVHKGHINVCKRVLKSKIVKEVWFLPAYKSHRGKKYISYNHRVAMLQIAAKNFSNIQICEMEGKVKAARSDHEKIIQLQKDFPKINFYWICGSDLFIKIIQSNELKQILDLVPVIVVERNGSFYKGEYLKNSNIYYLKHKEDYRSSTLIRNGDFKEDMIIQRVKDYILKNKLYSLTASIRNGSTLAV